MFDIFQRAFRRENILIMVLIVGSILGVFGVPQNIGITENQLILALISVLAVDTLVEKLGYLDRIEAGIAEIQIKLKPKNSADSLLRTRADLPAFAYLLQTADEIWVLGRILDGFISTFGGQIEQAILQGKRFRFLMINPSSSSIIHTYITSSLIVDNVDSAKSTLNKTLNYLKRISKNTNTPSALEIRLIDSLPDYTCIIFDSQKPSGKMTVELYGYKVSPGERLHMIFHKKEEPVVFNFYINQFERMWRESAPLNTLEPTLPD